MNSLTAASIIKPSWAQALRNAEALEVCVGPDMLIDGCT